MDAEKEIAPADIALALEGTLSCDHVDLAQLGEG
jgi:hypothetical protein